MKVAGRELLRRSEWHSNLTVTVATPFGAASDWTVPGHHWPSPCRTIHIQTAVSGANLLASPGFIKISFHHYF
jgi:hypothetical protein